MSKFIIYSLYIGVLLNTVYNNYLLTLPHVF